MARKRKRDRQQGQTPPSPPQPTAWTVEFYADARGRIPVRDFLRSVQKGPGTKHVAKVERGIALLGDLGLAAPAETVHKIGKAAPDLYELRVAFQNQAYRVLLYNPDGRTLVLLHGYLHKRPSIEPELRVAVGRMEDDRKRREK